MWCDILNYNCCFDRCVILWTFRVTCKIFKWKYVINPLLMCYALYDVDTFNGATLEIINSILLKNLSRGDTLGRPCSSCSRVLERSSLSDRRRREWRARRRPQWLEPNCVYHIRKRRNFEERNPYRRRRRRCFVSWGGGGHVCNWSCDLMHACHRMSSLSSKLISVIYHHSGSWQRWIFLLTSAVC